MSSSSTATIVSLHSWQSWSHGGTCPSRGWRDRDIVSYTRADLKQSRATQARVGCACSTSSTARSSDTNQPPASDLVFSADIWENIAKYLAHIGQIVQITQLREVSLLTRDSSKFPKPMDEKITYRNSQQIGIDYTERKLFQLRKRRNFLQSFTWILARLFLEDQEFDVTKDILTLTSAGLGS